MQVDEVLASPWDVMWKNKHIKMILFFEFGIDVVILKKQRNPSFLSVICIQQILIPLHSDSWIAILFSEQIFTAKCFGESEIFFWWLEFHNIQRNVWTMLDSC